MIHICTLGHVGQENLLLRTVGGPKQRYLSALIRMTAPPPTQ